MNNATEHIETRCAVCQLSDGLVINMIVAAPSDLPPDGTQLVEVMNEQPCDIGWYWDGVQFTDPNPVPDVPLAETVSAPIEPVVETLTEETPAAADEVIISGD